jgi:hypothetical protein
VAEKKPIHEREEEEKELILDIYHSTIIYENISYWWKSRLFPIISIMLKQVQLQIQIT